MCGIPISIIFDILLFFDVYRIPYVRFDGQMSAKRRQETIARFSVPLEEGAVHAVPAETAVPNSGRRSRKVYDNADEEIIDLAGSDDDFHMTGSQDDDDDFIDDEDDDAAFSRKKGKSKAKAKGKAKATAKPSKASIRAGLDGTSFTGVNPKVMLISLKAVRVQNSRLFLSKAILLRELSVSI